MRENNSNGIKHRQRFKAYQAESGRGIMSTLLMVLVSCLAWFYIAGRLWQDAEMRKLLTSLLQQNNEQVTRIMNVDEQLMNLRCKDLGKKIADLETELAFARSQGYLHKRPTWNANPEKRLLAVIGIQTGFGSHLNRNRIRNTWLPTGQALKTLEEKGIVIRFVVGRSANRGDSLDRQINAEMQKTNDFLVLESHEEATEELPQKAKLFFSSAVEYWDADFYVRVEDNIYLNLDEFVKILAGLRDKRRVYMGCMKSGDVISEEGQQWYEPEWWKFGDQKSYLRHAAAPFYVLSRDLAHHININSVYLKPYAHEDISVGAWMIGLDAEYIDERRFCCTEGEICSIR
ncbi:hypothetical protein SUGI_0407970 [Cryptomeria japonica]|nr:hypothetical protein SUGI_0407970 [Cryptomeria japonica]